MKSVHQTTRQHLMELLAKKLFTARELAAHVDLRERLVEDHLLHIIRSLERNKTQNFVMEQPECQDCGYKFLNRTRLKRPSRCPQCRSQAISSPRFTITQRQEKASKK